MLSYLLWIPAYTGMTDKVRLFLSMPSSSDLYIQLSKVTRSDSNPTRLRSALEKSIPIKITSRPA